jgi:hypothetical protein
MENNNYRNLEQHVTILGWLHIALSALLVLAAGLVFVVVVGGGLFAGDAEATAITSLVGTIMAGFLLVLAAPGIVAGIGLLKRKPWSRVLAIVLAILNLVNFPLGTVIGVYTLWVLVQDEAVALFASQKAA